MQIDFHFYITLFLLIFARTSLIPVRWHYLTVVRAFNDIYREFRCLGMNFWIIRKPQWENGVLYKHRQRGPPHLPEFLSVLDYYFFDAVKIPRVTVWCDNESSDFRTEATGHSNHKGKPTVCMIFELTVGFETNMQKNTERKELTRTSYPD